jgi:hypothetical protein
MTDRDVAVVEDGSQLSTCGKIFLLRGNPPVHLKNTMMTRKHTLRMRRLASLFV